MSISHHSNSGANDLLLLVWEPSLVVYRLRIKSVRMSLSYSPQSDEGEDDVEEEEVESETLPEADRQDP